MGAGGIGIETPPHPRVVPPPGIRLWDSDWTAVGACALGLAQNQFAGRSNSTFCELQNVKIELALSFKTEEGMEFKERKQVSQGQVTVGLISDM